MAATYDKWEGRWTISGSTHGFKIDGGSFVYLPAGSYYWSSGVDGGASLASAIATLISATVASTTCTIADSTGLMTIHFGSGNHTLTAWTTSLKAMCGLAYDCEPAAHTHESGYQVKRLWLPDHLPSNLEGSLYTLGKRKIDRRTFPCRNGAQWSRLGSDWYERTYEYRALDDAKVFTSCEVLGNESFETFLFDCFLENPVRHYTDRTDDTSYLTPMVYGSQTAREYVLGEYEEFNPGRVSKTDCTWDLTFPVRQNVEA